MCGGNAALCQITLITCYKCRDNSDKVTKTLQGTLHRYAKQHKTVVIIFHLICWTVINAHIKDYNSWEISFLGLDRPIWSLSQDLTMYMPILVCFQCCCITQAHDLNVAAFARSHLTRNHYGTDIIHSKTFCFRLTSGTNTTTEVRERN